LIQVLGVSKNVNTKISKVNESKSENVLGDNFDPEAKKVEK